ncbi:amino acid/amide ABC transporter membrane protein 1, HAAT family [Desulfonispora thiosulfatigenes DSM 11270]|uniref:Amino acid/amide ABC transporter membrane protein 1, HAAT family n=1 Tax=Desulfonispora thiosulfatigenes DSM 11270 TaxID=656914 RepID=A0A1W1VE82_DESTI|nr:branched-chain amino acid ABC transporter permease [Desulfonispora thiosulfatigenes]SMB91678.1 amino acid/amide ABC transporter membrane protein 1, HAAT family [Desulfonispora thiosulfatigenes DSM 11270]
MVDTAVIIQQILNALSLGAMYVLVAVGFTLFFGVIDIINFSHGEIFMLGAFIALTTIGFFAGTGFLTQHYILVFIIVLLVTVILSGLVGSVIERTIIKPMRGASDLMLLLLTLGVSIIIREGVMIFYPNGANPQSFPDLFPNESLTIFNVVIKYEQIFIIALSLFLVILLHLFVTKTRYGRYMLATSQDKEAAMMMGISIDRIIILTFFIGSALGAIAGLMNGIYYNIIKFNMGFLIGIKGFSAAVVGGLGNIYGAIVGGFLLGFLEMFAAAFIPGGSRYQDVIGFVIVILFLVFKPSGIFGEKVYEKV